MTATTRRNPLRTAVVDASVAVKWVFAEDHLDAALRLLGQADSLLAPAHWLAEATNALWAKSIRGDLSEAEVPGGQFPRRLGAQRRRPGDRHGHLVPRPEADQRGADWRARPARVEPGRLT